MKLRWKLNYIFLYRYNIAERYKNSITKIILDGNHIGVINGKLINNLLYKYKRLLLYQKI